MNWQVTSLDLSKQMKEAGFEQESLFWHWRKDSSSPIHIIFDPNLRAYEENGQLGEIIAPAYTVAELGKMLPKTISKDGSKKINLIGNELWIYIDYDAGAYWHCGYSEDNEQSQDWDRAGKTMAEAMAKMLLYLKENGLLKQLQTKEE